MIRQARSYFAGAVSATAVIAIAVVAFVVLVSLQALRDWPLAALGGRSEQGVSISATRPVARRAIGLNSVVAVKGAAARRAGSAGRGTNLNGAPQNVAATVPSASGSPDSLSEPGGGNGSTGATAPSSQGGSASASPNREGGSSTVDIGQTIGDAVSGVGQALSEPAAEATQAVEGVVEQATTSPAAGQTSGQANEVADGLPGGDR